ncbi:hypothetical protein RCL1_007728 [Eukaryota sp. TZLM3-RCL]
MVSSLVTNQDYDISVYDVKMFLPNVLDDHTRQVAAADSQEFLAFNILNHKKIDRKWYFQVELQHGVIQWERLETEEPRK